MPKRLTERINKEVRLILKERREACGLSMTRSAERAGLSQQSVSYIERGMRDPSLDSLLRLCGAYGIELSSVLQEAETRCKK